MTSSSAATPLLTVPLGGAPCVHCGQPARALAITADQRVIAHEARIPHCHSPITDADAANSPILRQAILRPATPEMRRAAA
jgi:hypothetical protein